MLSNGGGRETATVRISQTKFVAVRPGSSQIDEQDLGQVDYRVESLVNLEQLRDYRDAFERNDYPKDLDELAWVHLNNPVGTTVTSLTRSPSNDVAAIYAAMPVVVDLDGQQRLACQSLDTLTDSDHRGKGLFVTSATEIYGEARSRGYQFVYGFPNGQSAHGFVSRLGWTLHDPVPFLIRPLRSGYPLQRVFGSRLGKVLDFPIVRRHHLHLLATESVQDIDRFSDDVTALWDRFSQKIKVAVRRDSKYLNWRFVDKPTHTYTRLGYYRNGQLRGVIVFSVQEKHGGCVGYVMELIVDPDDRRVGDVLIQAALNSFVDASADFVLSWCMESSPNYLDFKRGRFVELPQALRPIELHFGYVDMGDSDPTLKSRDNWYISYADSDTV